MLYEMFYLLLKRLMLAQNIPGIFKPVSCPPRFSTGSFRSTACSWQHPL